MVHHFNHDCVQFGHFTSASEAFFTQRLYGNYSPSFHLRNALLIMPANTKYLTQNGFQRFAKITAGLIGGYAISALFHVGLALVTDHKIVLITSIFSLYLLWMTLFIVVFLFKSGWKALAIYTSVTLLLSLLVNSLQTNHPIL